jgi:hypothetical protein
MWIMQYINEADEPERTSSAPSPSGPVNQIEEEQNKCDRYFLFKEIKLVTLHWLAHNK